MGAGHHPGQARIIILCFVVFLVYFSIFRYVKRNYFGDLSSTEYQKACVLVIEGLSRIFRDVRTDRPMSALFHASPITFFFEGHKRFSTSVNGRLQLCRSSVLVSRRRLRDLILGACYQTELSAEQIKELLFVTFILL